MTVRVLVVDDHPVVRDGVEMLARTNPNIQIAGYAASGHDALRIAPEVRPDVILLDLRLPDMLAPELIRELRVAVPAAKVVLFTAYPDHPAVGAALEAGAYGVFPKDASRMDLVAGIMRAMRPEGSEPAPSGSSLRRDTHSPIARREYDVLRRLATGETNSEIATAMQLSPNTVKAYLRNLMQKLRARNRVEAISRAREMGLL
ncbi:MAG: liaR [Candidatus Eremiobacteraeota bacterium]|nr:liaR [Candidatus Eremiobacteraeota bacterium]